MFADLPPADPPSSGICSHLWDAHRGDADSGGEKTGTEDYSEIVVDVDDAQTSTSLCSAHACLRHPFVRSLADGSLPTESFQFYVAQGMRFLFRFRLVFCLGAPPSFPLTALSSCCCSLFPSLSRTTDFHFLTAFSRAYALAADAAAAAGDGEASFILRELRESVDEELGLHRGFAASWGVVLLEGDGASPSLPRPSAATTAYTSFLLETANEASRHSLAGVSRALAAMVPCCRLYGWLGVKLAREKAERAERAGRAERADRAESAKKKKDTPEAENPFRAWIETYSSVAYHAATVKLEKLLDKLAEGLSAEERGEFFFLYFFHFFHFFHFFRFGRRRCRASLLESNYALAACCSCFIFSHLEQQQQQKKEKQ